MNPLLSSRPLQQLRTICDNHPRQPKVVFVPHTQAGSTLVAGLARYGGSWMGLNCATPLSYAQGLATWSVQGERPLGLADQPFLVASIVKDIPSEILTSDLPQPEYMARMIATAVDTLRSNGINASQLERHADDNSAPPMMRILSNCYTRYHDALYDSRVYDDAEIVRSATKLISSKELPEIAQTVFAICDTTDLPNLTCLFINAVRERGAAFYRLGRDNSDTPAHSAAAYFESVELPDGTEDLTPEREITTHRAAGVQYEVDGVFRTILQDQLPLDEIEIAYTNVHPYLSLLSSRAEALDFPVRFSAGQPAEQTLTGQSLLGFYEWIQNGYDIETLVRMLRAGLFRIDKIQRKETVPHTFNGPELASFLAERSYEPGREGYEKAFRIAHEQATHTRDQAVERELDTAADDEKLQRIESTHVILGELFDLTPTSCSLTQFAKNSRAFIERFGPIDPAHDQEERRDLEEAARQVLYQKLENLTESPVSYNASSAQLARMLADTLSNQFVRSEQPKEGSASIVPLDSAGYSGRRHLFVVGMDAETLSLPVMDDALLRDADRAALTEDMDIEMATSRGAADESMWRMEQALARHQGDLHLFANVFDLESNEARFPSTLFLELEEAGYGGSDISIRLQDGELPLDDRAAWIKARTDVPQLIETPHPTAQDELSERYPTIMEGRYARAQMASGMYTEYDGLLREGSYPTLDIRSDTNSSADIHSAGGLEMLAETPYVYFLKYQLDASPLDEPALDDEAWLSNLRRGNILHNTFERFMRSVGTEPVTSAHEEELLQMLEQEIEAEKREVGPPSERIEASARRLLQTDARIFLRAEANRPDDVTPRMHEVGFGSTRRWRREDDFDAATLTFPNGATIKLRGRIDRVDERVGQGLSVVDYKTGSARNYSEADPLKEGAHLQWALYAYALEELTDETVVSSGYFFASAKEMGLRVLADPAEYRDEVGMLLNRLGEMSEQGSFPMTPNASDAGPWRWGGYDRLYHDLNARMSELDEKEFPADRVAPVFLSKE